MFRLRASHFNVVLNLGAWEVWPKCPGTFLKNRPQNGCTATSGKFVMIFHYPVDLSELERFRLEQEEEEGAFAVVQFPNLSNEQVRRQFQGTMC